MANIREKLLQQRKNNVIERGSFDVKNLSQRKTNLKSVFDKHSTIEEIEDFIKQNENYVKNRNDIKIPRTESERRINDIRYRSNTVEHLR